MGKVSAPRYAEGHRARVILGRAPVHCGPAADSPLGTHYHYGERVLVFDEVRKIAWCQSCDDSYVGYVSARHLSFDEVPEPTHYVANLGAYTYRVPDLHTAPLDFLPRHSPVVVAEIGLFTRGTEYARLDPAGFLPLSCLSRSPPRSPDLIAAVSLYLGAPYLWGGRSLLGLDCSGLVQQAFRDLGIAVPRDADLQQAAIGAPVPASGITDLARGDLIYMPGHVMICAGDGEIIHASGVGMAVRRDDLAAVMRDWNLDFAKFTVRRPPALSG